MRVEVVIDDPGVLALAPEWRDLWRRAGACPFKSAAWMLAWWRCFGTGRPVVAVARGSAGVAGLLPCYMLGRKLLPMGAGITDYQDVLGAEAPALLGAVLEAARAAGAQTCDFTDLPPGAAMRTAPAPPGWQESLLDSDPCPVLGRVPAGRGRDVRQALHRAARAGGSTIEVATADTLDRLLDELERLHAVRWQGEADPRVAEFHRLAAPALLADGALRLAVLRIAGTAAAACCVLLAPGRALFYLSGFDKRFAYESPGTILLGRLIEDAAAEGREVHFLRGGEAYKYAWGGVDRMNATRRLVPA